MVDFDATSLYPSVMYDENLVYPKIESGFAFKLHMKEIYVKSFIDQIFNQDGDKPTLVKTKKCKPGILVFQHLPVKEKAKKIVVN